MKTAIVPAQITTVEDKIAGGLGLAQLTLLMVPIFAGAAVYAIFPPVLYVSSFKIAISMVLALICGLLAVKVKGKLLLHWALIIGAYNLRPRYYIFDKNDRFMRQPRIYKLAPVEPPAVEPSLKAIVGLSRPALTMASALSLEDKLGDLGADLSFRSGKKGLTSVVITQVK